MMATREELQSMLREKYALETDLRHFLFLSEQLSAALPGKKAAVRQTETALTEYTHSWFRSFRDKLSGTWEEKKEDLHREKLNAANALNQTQRELQDLKRQIQIAREELRDLDIRLEEAAQQLREDETLQQLRRRLEARLLVRDLLPMLKKNAEALEDAADCIRNRDMRMDSLRLQQEQHESLSRADALAKQSRALLEKLMDCGILLEIHPYFENPTGYIVGTAMKYGMLDRINGALRAIRETEDQARELIAQLTQA